MNQLPKDHECPVCLNIFLNPVILPKCKHVFCFRCIKNVTDNSRKNHNPCPLCRKLFTITELIAAKELKQTLELLHPKQLQLKKQETVIEKTAQLILGHEFVKQSSQADCQQPSKQVFSWKFFIRALPYLHGMPDTKRTNIHKDIQKIEVRLHPSLKNNIIAFNVTQDPKNFEFQVSRTSQSFFNFRVFVDLIWKQHCGSGRTELHYDLDDKVNSVSSKAQKMVKIQMNLRPS